MTDGSNAVEMVDQYLRATDPVVARRIASELSECLYDQDSLLALEPIFESTKVEHARTLAALLFEHGDRSHEVVPWLEALIDHPDESVRYAAIGCVFELDARQHAPLVAKAVTRMRDADSVAASVSVYLSLAEDEQLRNVAPLLDVELRDLTSWLIRHEYSDWDERFGRGGASSLVALAAAGREPGDQSERLNRAESSDNTAVQLAARRVAARLSRG